MSFVWKQKLNMQFWHRVICVTDLESYFLLPFRVLHPIAHCASIIALLLIFVHGNKPSFLLVHKEPLLWFSHWEGWFPYTIADWPFCNGDALFVFLRYELNFKPIWLISHFKTILTRDMLFIRATIYTINLQWNSGGEQAKMLGLSCVCFCGFVCVCVGFVVCGCFGNMYTVLWMRFFLPWLRFFRAFSSLVRQMPG